MSIVATLMAHPKIVICCMAIVTIMGIAAYKRRFPTAGEALRLSGFCLAALKAVSIALVALPNVDDPVTGDTNFAMLVGALVVGFAGGDGIVQIMKRILLDPGAIPPVAAAAIPALASPNLPLNVEASKSGLKAVVEQEAE